MTARPATAGRAVTRAPSTAAPPPPQVAATGRHDGTTRTLLEGTDGSGIVRVTVLPGGLRVLTETRPSLRSVCFGVWAQVGSRDESAALNGATHFLEHLLFKGTRRRSALEISAAIDAVGGEMNAFTTKEYTCYYARVLDRDLPLAVDVVCDMLTDAVLRAEDVDAERGVVLEEIAMTEDDPGDCVHDLFAHALFGDAPLGRPVLGTAQTVHGLTRDRLARFYRRHYLPSRLVVTAAGNLDHDELVRLVYDAFARADALGPADAAPRGPRTGSRRPRTAAGRVEVRRRRTEQAHVVLGMPGLPRTDGRRWALEVLSTALGGGMSSRLFQEVRERRGLAYSVYTHTSGYADCGIFGVYAGCRPRYVHDVLRICRDELARIAEDGLGEEELRRAQGQCSGSTVLELEDSGALMHRLGKSEVCWGEQLSVDALLARIAAVTPEDVQAVARDMVEQRPSLAAIGPFTAAQAARLEQAVT